LLKGEQGKPRIRGNTNKGKDVSSEAERKERGKRRRRNQRPRSTKSNLIESRYVTDLPEHK